MADTSKLTCEAPADRKVLGGPRCGKTAAYATPLGYRCAACADQLRADARNPKMFINVMAGRARTEEEIEAMIKALN